MEEKKYSIHVISRLLDIPKATIRYWNQEGLISPPRNGKNSYREFSLADAMELSNISFYRSIGIPMKELKQMLCSDIWIQETLLEEAKERLEETQRKLKQQAERIRTQQKALEQIRWLKERPLAPGAPPFIKVGAFSHWKEEHWKKISLEPGAFVLMLGKTKEDGVQYGIGYGPGEWQEEEALLWEQKGQTFLEGLLVANSRDESQNDLDRQIELLKSQGITTGRVIAQYLTSGVNRPGEAFDYYKMWVEVKSSSEECRR